MAALTGGVAEPGAPLSVLVSTGRTDQRGSLTLASGDPEAPPVLEFRYLCSVVDRRRLREAVRLAAELLATRAFATVSAGSLGPDRAVLADDRALDRWIHGRLGTALHTCGTVPFRLRDGSPGPVDQFGSVRGVTALRVADTSILPSVPERGPAVSAVLVGELVADAMRQNSA